MAAVVLIATAADPDANTYCTLAEAECYVAGVAYPGKWADADADQKNRALVTATRMLDDAMDWFGFPTTYEQRLQHPRIGLVTRTGDEVDDSFVADAVKDATSELGVQVLNANRDADNDAEATGLSSLSAAGVSLSFKSTAKSKPIPDSVARALAHLGQVKGTGFSVPLVRT